MGGENYVAYDNEVAKRNIGEGNFRDYDGNKIGTMENVQTALGRTMFGCGVMVGLENKATAIGMRQVKNAIYDYIVARHCFEEDTPIQDSCLNKLMESVPPLMKLLEYKLIN